MANRWFKVERSGRPGRPISLLLYCCKRNGAWVTFDGGRCYAVLDTIVARTEGYTSVRDSSGAVVYESVAKCYDLDRRLACAMKHEKFQKV